MTPPAVRQLVRGRLQAWNRYLVFGKLHDSYDLHQADLGQPSSVALAATREALQDPNTNHQYSDLRGDPQLRHSISSFYSRRYSSSKRYDPATEICVTSSGQEAICCALLALCEPGDRVIMFEPFYPFFAEMIEMAGAQVHPIRLDPPDFCIRAAESKLRSAFETDSRVACILSASPSNPSGRMATLEELQLLASLCTEHDTYAISDEVYEADSMRKLSKKEHLRLADMPGMEDRTLTVSGASKMFALSGWRIGWVLGSPELIESIALWFSAKTHGLPSVLQQGIRAALDSDDVTKRGARVEANAIRLADGFRSLGCTPYLPEGGHYMIVDCAPVDGEAFASELWRKAKVAVCPMLPFTYLMEPTTHVRVAVCVSDDVAQGAYDALKQLGPDFLDKCQSESE